MTSRHRGASICASAGPWGRTSCRDANAWPCALPLRRDDVILFRPASLRGGRWVVPVEHRDASVLERRRLGTVEHHVNASVLANLIDVDLARRMRRLADAREFGALGLRLAEPAETGPVGRLVKD